MENVYKDNLRYKIVNNIIQVLKICVYNVKKNIFLIIIKILVLKIFLIV